MKREYDTEFEAKAGAGPLDEDSGIVGASKKFDVPNDLAYEWAKALVLRRKVAMRRNCGDAGTFIRKV